MSSGRCLTLVAVDPKVEQTAAPSCPLEFECVEVGVRGLLLYGLSLRLNHNHTIIEVRQLLNAIFMHDKHIGVFEAPDTLN